MLKHQLYFGQFDIIINHILFLINHLAEVNGIL